MATVLNLIWRGAAARTFRRAVSPDTSPPFGTAAPGAIFSSCCVELSNRSRSSASAQSSGLLRSEQQRSSGES